jgi:hypothetical protein
MVMAKYVLLKLYGVFELGGNYDLILLAND